MNKLLKNVDNELFVLNACNNKFETPYLSLKEIFNNVKNLNLYHFSRDYLMINNLIIKRNYISSPISSLNLLTKKGSRYSILDDLSFPYVVKHVFFKKDRAKAIERFNKLLVKGDVLLVSNDDLVQKTITTLDEFHASWDEVTLTSDRIILMNKIEGDPFKIFINNSGIVAVYGIIPAKIVGDGYSSIEDLIDKHNEIRSHNLLYKDYLLSSSDLKYKVSEIPLKGEIVKINHSFEVFNGATYIDLTDRLRDKFKTIASVFKQLLHKINYLEITCFSTDFLAGINTSSFRIGEIKQNTADLRHLFACCSSVEHLESLLFILFQKNCKVKVQAPSILYPAKKFDHTLFNKARQTSILKEASDRLGLIHRFEKPDLSIIGDPNTGKEIAFNSGMSQETCYFSRVASNDKFFTKKLLEKHGINTPVGFVMKIKDRDLAYSKLDFSLYKSWVIKPLNGSGGSGVSTGIENREDFDRAWNICESLKTKTVLMEEQVTGNDYRIVIIQNKVCAVTQRIAAYIIGDGVNTIDELVRIKAKERENNPFYRLKVFEINSVVKNYLEDQGLSIDYIPEMGQKVALLEAVNIGSGGESIDRTDEIHPDWIDIAVRARKAILDAYHVGLDLMAENISLPPSKQKWSIIEVNTNPDLGLQLYPGEGIPRDIGRSLLESVFGHLEDPKKLACNIKIIGLVKGVGFRKWFKSICEDRSIIGFVKNEIEADAVEANILGPEVVLNEIFKLVRSGPKKARVDKVIINYIDTNNITNNIGLEII